MTDQQHTPGPWHAPGLGEIHDINNRCIALLVDVDPVREEERPVPNYDEGEANARRIVACVNACEGVSTVGLEKVGADFIKPMAELEQQRDKLMSFVEEYIEAWNDGMAGDSFLLRSAKELISAVKGETT